MAEPDRTTLGVWKLSTSGLDEDDAVHEFATKEAALAYAAWWFLDGYMENETMRDQPDESVYRYLKQLLEDLTAGEEFHCGRFYERAALTRIEEPSNV